MVGRTAGRAVGRTVGRAFGRMVGLSGALAERSDASANAVRLLLLTGARRGEALSARWGHFDLQAGTWVKPSAHTKQKLEHRIPLSAPALQLLADKGLAPFFGPVFGGDSFALKKPDPFPLLEACKALGNTPAQTLVVGDSSNDALAARAAGCPVWLLRYGYNHGEPVELVDADGVIDRLDELPFD